MRTLETLPTEMVREIFLHVDDPDLCNLRLVSRYIGEVASTIFMEEIGFCMAKQDFDMLGALADHPVYPNHIASLVYFVDTLSLEPQTLEMYTAAIKGTEKMMSQFPDPDPALTEAQLLEHYNRYQQFYREQDDILSSDRDYEVLKEVISKLPNLREVSVSSDDEFSFQQNSPFKSCRHSGVGDFAYNRASVRHLRAILSGVQAAGTKLKAIRAGLIHHEFFDEAKFGLHSMIDLLGNITWFDMVIEATGEMDWDIGHENPDEIAAEIALCRAVMSKRVLRRILDAMPNIVSLRLELVEIHSQPTGANVYPAALRDIVPLDKKWPNLKYFTISNVETDRQELGNFLVRHKETLKSYALEQIGLASTSWIELLSYLKSNFADTKVQPLIADLIVGKSEDGLDTLEMWDLFMSDPPSDINSLQAAVHDYLTSSMECPCPLRDDNMWSTDAEFDDHDDEFDDDDDEFDVEDDDASDWEEDDDGMDYGWDIPELFSGLVFPGLAHQWRMAHMRGESDLDEEESEESEDDMPELV
ncbi:hypothetical protein QBC37DRAFT_428068 [Rhypophila decipiens]|uniref:F-box domain-containing protein n=1 Tax=Rhypophila decipiens TaxID=261697 RepID=A0AAN6Y638_9PEZI|nr:hypothetical protein QBC37DRAFT_428068 [Rhypophila decipiens]